MRSKFAEEISRFTMLPRSLDTVASRFDDILEELNRTLTKSQIGVGSAVRSTAERLFVRATNDVQQGSMDDRPLYWARLKFQHLLRQHGTERYGDLAERVSRGMETRIAVEEPCVVVTGFDPFSLDTQIEQSNPSGLIGLSLNGRDILGYRILSAIFPVRYRDFDDWIVESCLAHFLTSTQTAMVVSTSMGRDRFDLERFVGKRRSSIKPDNAGVVASADQPTVPTKLEGPEFLEYSLPVQDMVVNSEDGRWPVRDNRAVTTEESGDIECQDLQQLDGMKSVNGSGGGFLSNEIAYRSQLLRHNLRVSTPVGHIHVPRVDGYDEVTEQAIVAQFESILRNLIRNLELTG